MTCCMVKVFENPDLVHNIFSFFLVDIKKTFSKNTYEYMTILYYNAIKCSASCLLINKSWNRVVIEQIMLKFNSYYVSYNNSTLVHKTTRFCVDRFFWIEFWKWLLSHANLLKTNTINTRNHLNISWNNKYIRRKSLNRTFYKSKTLAYSWCWNCNYYDKHMSHPCRRKVEGKDFYCYTHQKKRCILNDYNKKHVTGIISKPIFQY